MCQWNCENDCQTYGQHLRNKGIGFNGVFLTRSNGAGRGDSSAQKKWDTELDRYADVRKQGIQPDGTSMNKIVAAEKKSESVGEAYGTDAYQHALTKRVAEKYAD